MLHTRLNRCLLALAMTIGSVALSHGALAAETPSSPSAISGPRELLDRAGIDDRQFAKLADREPWQPLENEVLLRVLHRTLQMRLSDLERWAQPLDPVRLVNDPAAHRGEAYRIVGRAVAVEVVPPSPQMAARRELPECFRVEFQLADGQRATVFAGHVPEAWKSQRSLRERASALGLFLKLGKDADGQLVPIFAAPRVAWYPDTLLGNLGMDVGLLDNVGQEQKEGGPQGPESAAKVDVGRLRLSIEDREPFYQMLAAVGRATPGQLLREAQDQLRRSNRSSDSVVPLFNEPETRLGQLVVLSGTARRVIPIRISDEDLVARLGMDRYYEIYLFTDDSQGNPVVFCVRELPPGMPTGEGPQFGESMTLAGFFFKTWAYRRADRTSPGKTEWQLAPLLIGREPTWSPAATADSVSGYDTVTVGLLLVFLAGLCLLVWHYHRSDRKIRQRMIQRSSPARQAAPDRQGFDAIDPGPGSASDREDEARKSY